MQLFTPLPLLTGGRFGAFLVMLRREDAARNAPIGQASTKSVPLGTFMDKDERVSLIMEDPLSASEIESAYTVLRNQHPPVDFEAPSKECAKRVQCTSVLRSELLTSKYVTFHDGPLPGPEEVDPPLLSEAERAQWAEKPYLIRSGKVKTEEMASLKRIIEDAAGEGLLKGVHLYPEWITDDVGGYLMVLLLNRSVAVRVLEECEEMMKSNEK